jgi:gamma-glutamylcyclotransferase (GGCT)/AIG2-like uncharacterized protein YtfP
MRELGKSRLFVYDSLLVGEPEHDHLAGAELTGTAETEPRFTLVELQGFGALVPGGTDRVRGEIYLVDARTLARLDALRRVPMLFQRTRIVLADGSQAETFLMPAGDVRGCRRLHRGDWRARFAPRVGRDESRPIVAWARSRMPKG